VYVTVFTVHHDLPYWSGGEKRQGWLAIGLKARGLALADPTCRGVFFPAACHARPSAIATKNAHFAFLAIFWESEKGPGWPAIGLTARGLALTDLTCLCLFSCWLSRATEYHSNERRPFRISLHFGTLSHTLSCHEPCLLTSAACLLPPAAADCYICCPRLLCENQTRGRSSLDSILGRVLSNQFLGWFGRSLEHEAASSTRGKNPIGAGTKGAIEWGDAHSCCTLTPHFSWSLSTSNFDWTPHCSTEGQCWPQPTCRSHPSPTMNLRCACDRFFDPPQPCLHVNLLHVCER